MIKYCRLHIVAIDKNRHAGFTSFKLASHTRSKRSNDNETDRVSSGRCYSHSIVAGGFPEMS